MPDVFTRAKRSAVMARIRSRGNKDTELALMRVFRAHRITGWRRHVEIRSADFQIGPRRTGVRRSDGARRTARLTFRVRPDFVFPKVRLAVFVDGCFWHGCPQHATKPKGNASFWRKKLAGNKARDLRVNLALRRAGWRVLRVWEHELAKIKPLSKPGAHSFLAQKGIGNRNELRLLRRIRTALGHRPDVSS